MNVLRLSPECIECLIKKHINAYPDWADKKTKVEYMQGVLSIISKATPDMSAPILFRQISLLKKEMFNEFPDFSKVKSFYNNLMLTMEEDLYSAVINSKNPLKTAVQYAMIGNYIDFAANKNVNEEDFKKILATVSNYKLDEKTLKDLEKDIFTAKSLTYVLDNCGEIVLDKIFIRLIKKMNPKINVIALVRGEPVINDVTMDDALEVGLSEYATVLDNGRGDTGTWIEKICSKARDALYNADVIISKGQGNFETMQMCKLNVYYVFMCKCSMFSNKFGVPLLSGMLINDKDC